MFYGSIDILVLRIFIIEKLFIFDFSGAA